MGALMYVFYLGWYFRMSTETVDWHPMDMYTHIAEAEMTTASATPAQDCVFDAKINVPMTSSSRLRHSNYKRAGAQHTRSMISLWKKSSAVVASSIGGLYATSQATFKSFGTWGLMVPVANTHTPHAEQQAGATPVLMGYIMYPYTQTISNQTTSDMQLAAQSGVISTPVRATAPR